MARQPLDAPDPAALMNEMGASTASRIRGSGPLLAAILLLGSQMVAGSEGPGRVQAANGGRLVWAPDGVRQAEEIGLSAGLAPALSGSRMIRKYAARTKASQARRKCSPFEARRTPPMLTTRALLRPIEGY